MASEFELIERFCAAFSPPRAPRGPGDDCAVLARPQGELCVTTDAVVQGVHFSFPAFSAEDVGHKALAVNLSDLAAMGARPTWFVCALGLPSGTRPDQVLRLSRGMAALAREHRISLVGGNFTRSPVLSVTLTVAGEVKKGQALLRSGARPGDGLYVSGTLGEARVGLRVRRLSLRQRRPTPRVGLGLLSVRFARAAIDLSDGLAQDVGQLCRSSRVGAQLELGRLPISEALVRAVGGREKALEEALRGGEDYELCLSVPPAKEAAFVRACQRAGHQVTRVGQITPGRSLRILDGEGQSVASPAGFDHFG